MSDGGVTSGDGCAVATARAQCVFARARSVFTYISCQPPTPPTHCVSMCLLFVLRNDACRNRQGVFSIYDKIPIYLDIYIYMCLYMFICI